MLRAYFHYDSKKSGGVTQSHLRFGKTPIRSTYLVKTADFIACHNQAYIHMYDILGDIKEGGTFLFNTVWSPEELDEKLPSKVKHQLAQKHVKFYIINAEDVDKELKLNGKTNAVLQAAFFKLANIIPIDTAVKYMKEMIVKSYGKKGEDVVNKNFAAVDAGLDKIVEVPVPESWATCPDDAPVVKNVPDFVRDVVMPMNACDGDALPVSAFNGREDGHFPLGTAAYEKRGVAVSVPVWDAAKCIQCNQCSASCPHAAIRPILLTDEEAANAPESFATKPAMGPELKGLQYRMQVAPLDCLGCGVCANVCPEKVQAITMKPIDEVADTEEGNWEYAMTVPNKANLVDTKKSIKNSQFAMPYLEFSGACAGCGETPYIKLITQLFGDRMMIANATGCTSIWGGSAPSMPYCN